MPNTKIKVKALKDCKLIVRKLSTAEVYTDDIKYYNDDRLQVLNTSKPTITVTTQDLSVPVGAVVNKAYMIANNGLVVTDDVDGNITATPQVVLHGQVNTAAINTVPQLTIVKAIDTSDNQVDKMVNVLVVAAKDFKNIKQPSEEVIEEEVFESLDLEDIVDEVVDKPIKKKTNK